jgi:hypothetical protein
MDVSMLARVLSLRRRLRHEPWTRDDLLRRQSADLAVQTYLEGHNGSAETPATTPVGPGWESRRSPR